jgi:hypothetical protein
MRHATKDKGDLAVAKALAKLREHDIRACLPLSEHLPFDLIAVMPDLQTLRRVQVKYRADKGTGAMQLVFRSNYYDSKRIYSKWVDLEELDCYTIYCPDTDRLYWLRVDEIPLGARAAVFRIKPTKNGQKKGVWLAENFLNPIRIGQNDLCLPVSCREVSEQDELAITQVIADLVAHEIQPCLSQSQYLPFDLIGVMPDMKTMHRIRVGYETVQTNHAIDLYAIYDPRSRMCSYIPADSLNEQCKIVALNENADQHDLPLENLQELCRIS